MKIGIVGGLGIGAAHAIAARELGFDIAWVVDTNVEEVSRRYIPGGTITNNWAYITESAELNEDLVISNVIDKSLAKVDLVLICSPNMLHNEHCDLVGRFRLAPRVMVEKPAFLNYFSNDTLGLDVHFGYKGLRNKKLTDYLDSLNEVPKNIAFMHEYPPTHRKWSDNIIYDLGSHALSFIAYKWQSVLDDNIPQLLEYSENHAVFTVGPTKITLSYTPRGNITLWEPHTTEGVLANHQDAIIDEMAFDWPEDIFKTQLLYVLEEHENFFEGSNAIDKLLRQLVVQSMGLST